MKSRTNALTNFIFISMIYLRVESASDLSHEDNF